MNIPTQYVGALVQAKKCFKDKESALTTIMQAMDVCKGEWGSSSLIPDIDKLFSLITQSEDFADGVPLIKGSFSRISFRIILETLWPLIPDQASETPDNGGSSHEDDAQHSPWIDRSIKEVSGLDSPSELESAGLYEGWYNPNNNCNMHLWGGKISADGKWFVMYTDARNGNWLCGMCFWNEFVAIPRLNQRSHPVS